MSGDTWRHDTPEKDHEGYLMDVEMHGALPFVSLCVTGSGDDGGSIEVDEPRWFSNPSLSERKQRRRALSGWLPFLRLPESIC